MKRGLLSLCLFLLCIALQAQQQTILERVTCFSSVGPVMQYLNEPGIRQQVIGVLNEELRKRQLLPLRDTSLPLTRLNNLRQDPRSALPFTTADTTTDHLYLDIWEVSPMALALEGSNTTLDPQVLARSKSVIQFNMLLLDGQKQKKHDATLMISITEGGGSGIGIKVPHMTFTGKGLVDMIKASIGLAMNSDTDTDQLIEIRAQAAFYEDNFILPHLKDDPVYSTVIRNDVFSYPFNGEQQIIRLPKGMEEQLFLTGKKKNINEQSVLAQNILATGRSRSSDFVRLRQEGRDVINNRDYLVMLISEINPDFVYMTEAEVFSYFLPWDSHVFLQGTDTIAVFSITKGEGKPEKRYFMNRITNGSDSSSSVRISPNDVSRSMYYEYILNGTFKGQPFSIHCSQDGIREIYYQEKRAIVAMGATLPERFAVFDASLSPDIINQFLILAFNQYL